MSATFFVTGHIIRQNPFEMRDRYVLFMCAIVIVGSILMPTSMLGYNIWQIIPYYAFAVMGTLMVCYVSNKMTEHKGMVIAIMVMIGNKTLTILT